MLLCHLLDGFDVELRSIHFVQWLLLTTQLNQEFTRALHHRQVKCPSAQLHGRRQEVLDHVQTRHHLRTVAHPRNKKYDERLQVVHVDLQLLVRNLVVLPKRIEGLLDFRGAAFVNMLELAHWRLDLVDFLQLCDCYFVRLWLGLCALVAGMQAFVGRCLGLVKMAELCVHLKCLTDVELLQCDAILEQLRIILHALELLNLVVVQLGVEPKQDCVDFVADQHVCNHVFDQVSFDVVRA